MDFRLRFSVHQALSSIARVKVRARTLGYSYEQIKNGTGLGRYVAQRLSPAFIEEVGRYPTKHYIINDELDNVIHQYFRRSLVVSQ